MWPTAAHGMHDRVEAARGLHASMKRKLDRVVEGCFERGGIVGFETGARAVDARMEIAEGRPARGSTRASDIARVSGVDLLVLQRCIRTYVGVSPNLPYGGMASTRPRSSSARSIRLRSPISRRRSAMPIRPALAATSSAPSASPHAHSASGRVRSPIRASAVVDAALHRVVPAEALWTVAESAPLLIDLVEVLVRSALLGCRGRRRARRRRGRRGGRGK